MPTLLAIVERAQHEAREARRRGARAVAADARAAASESLRVAYVSAREASKDPRAVAIATTAAVALAMAWAAYSTSSPISDSDV